MNPLIQEFYNAKDATTAEVAASGTDYIHLETSRQESAGHTEWHQAPAPRVVFNDDVYPHAVSSWRPMTWRPVDAPPLPSLITINTPHFVLSQDEWRLIERILPKWTMHQAQVLLDAIAKYGPRFEVICDRVPDSQLPFTADECRLAAMIVFYTLKQRAMLVLREASYSDNSEGMSLPKEDSVATLLARVGVQTKQLLVNRQPGTSSQNTNVIPKVAGVEAALLVHAFRHLEQDHILKQFAYNFRASRLQSLIASYTPCARLRQAWSHETQQEISETEERTLAEEFARQYKEMQTQLQQITPKPQPAPSLACMAVQRATPQAVVAPDPRNDLRSCRILSRFLVNRIPRLNPVPDNVMAASQVSQSTLLQGWFTLPSTPVLTQNMSFFFQPRNEPGSARAAPLMAWPPESKLPAAHSAMGRCADGWYVFAVTPRSLLRTQTVDTSPSMFSDRIEGLHLVIPIQPDVMRFYQSELPDLLHVNMEPGELMTQFQLMEKELSGQRCYSIRLQLLREYAEQLMLQLAAEKLQLQQCEAELRSEME